MMPETIPGFELEQGDSESVQYQILQAKTIFVVVHGIQMPN